MKIINEVTPSDWLRDSSWETDELISALESNDAWDKFDEYMDGQFPDGIDETEFNDHCRFEVDQILEDLGIDEYDAAADDAENEFLAEEAFDDEDNY